MKKTILSILLLGVLLIGITGCGNTVSIHGSYSYESNYSRNRISYDFTSDGKCSHMIIEDGSITEDIQYDECKVEKKDDGTYIIVIKKDNRQITTLDYDYGNDIISDGKYKFLSKNSKVDNSSDAEEIDNKTSDFGDYKSTKKLLDLVELSFDSISFEYENEYYTKIDGKKWLILHGNINNISGDELDYQNIYAFLQKNSTMNSESGCITSFKAKKYGSQTQTSSVGNSEIIIAKSLDENYFNSSDKYSIEINVSNGSQIEKYNIDFAIKDFKNN